MMRGTVRISFVFPAACLAALAAAPCYGQPASGIPHLEKHGAAISWAQMEPSEGRYEFALVDGLIEEARRHDIKLVFLWFGSWKNGLSSYAPYWVKQDFRRFPRIRLGTGKSIEILSTFGDATRDADARAFRALMRH